MKRSPFWVIWCPFVVHPPKFRHPSRQSAVTEARRLTGLNPGQEFFVLQAEGCAVKDDIRYEEFSAPAPDEDDIPF